MEDSYLREDKKEGAHTSHLKNSYVEKGFDGFYLQRGHFQLYVRKNFPT